METATLLFLPISGWSGLLFYWRIWSCVCPLTHLPPWHKLPLLHIFSSFLYNSEPHSFLCFRCSAFRCSTQGLWGANCVQWAEAMDTATHLNTQDRDPPLQPSTPSLTKTFWPKVLIEMRLRNSHLSFFPFQILNFLFFVYSGLTMLWQFQVYSEGTKTYIYIYPFSLKPRRKTSPLTGFFKRISENMSGVC